MFADEIERGQSAARSEGMTFSEFIRQATNERSDRVHAKRGETAAPAA